MATAFRAIPSLVKHTVLAIWNKQSGQGSERATSAWLIAIASLARNGFLVAGMDGGQLVKVTLTQKGSRRTQEHLHEARTKGQAFDHEVAPQLEKAEREGRLVAPVPTATPASRGASHGVHHSRPAIHPSPSSVRPSKMLHPAPSRHAVKFKPTTRPQAAQAKKARVARAPSVKRAKRG